MKLETVHKGEKFSSRKTSRMKNIEFVGQLKHKRNLKIVYFVDF